MKKKKDMHAVNYSMISKGFEPIYKSDLERSKFERKDETTKRSGEQLEEQRHFFSVLFINELLHDESHSLWQF